MPLFDSERFSFILGEIAARDQDTPFLHWPELFEVSKKDDYWDPTEVLRATAKAARHDRDIYINRPCKVLLSLKQTLFHSGGEELTPGSREGDSGDEIYLIYVDVGQHVVGFAVRNELSIRLSCLVHEFEIQG